MLIVLKNIRAPPSVSVRLKVYKKRERASSLIGVLTAANVHQANINSCFYSYCVLSFK